MINESWVYRHSKGYEACDIAKSLGLFIVSHPPINPSKRACKPYDLQAMPKEYLARNRDIVNNTHILFACPDGPERLRSGTWSTIRYARKRKKVVIVITPEGNNEKET